MTRVVKLLPDLGKKASHYAQECRMGTLNDRHEPSSLSFLWQEIFPKLTVCNYE